MARRSPRPPPTASVDRSVVLTASRIFPLATASRDRVALARSELWLRPRLPVYRKLQAPIDHPVRHLQPLVHRVVKPRRSTQVFVPSGASIARHDDAGPPRDNVPCCRFSTTAAGDLSDIAGSGYRRVMPIECPPNRTSRRPPDTPPERLSPVLEPQRLAPARSFFQPFGATCIIQSKRCHER